MKIIFASVNLACHPLSFPFQIAGTQIEIETSLSFIPAAKKFLNVPIFRFAKRFVGAAENDRSVADH